MKKELWYWQYQVKIWDENGNKEHTCSGLVAATTITKAMKKLDLFYKETLMDVQALKPIMDGVFEFQLAADDDSFDYVINRKM